MSTRNLNRFMLVLLMVTLMVLSGCNRATTSQRVGLMSEAYITANNTMVIAAENGQLDLDDAERYESFRAPVESYLTVALDDLLDGDGDDSQAQNAIDILIPILDAMLEAQREATDE